MQPRPAECRSSAKYSCFLGQAFLPDISDASGIENVGHEEQLAPDLPGCLRVTVGTPDENKAFIAALQRSLSTI